MPRLPVRCFALLLLIDAPALNAQPVSEAAIDTLARDVSRVEALRDVKDLQRSYAHYAQFGLWDEMAALFAPDAALVWGEQTVNGRPAIARWLRTRLGGTRGLTPGALHTELIDEPLAHLSPDGTSAKSRWMVMVLTGDGKGKSGIEGGIFENDYKLVDGKWTISRLHFYPQYEGTYENGWSNHGGGDLPMVPFHFTIDETGVPLPPQSGPAPRSGADLAALERRIGALNAEDAVRNLVAAYGYYVDRRMWDDVVDLFSAEGAVEIVGSEVFRGAEGVRRAHETMGPQGLTRGQLNDYPIFDTLVEIGSGNREAEARSLVLGMLGDGEKAGWEFAVHQVRLVEEQGLWKIRELRIYPLMKADYAAGWSNGGTARLEHGVLPAFVEPHPVTGQPVTIAGFRLAGAEPLTGPVAAPAPAGTSVADDNIRLVEARRRLARSQAYEGVTNVSAAYGYYLDDFQWQEMASIFAKNGNKHSPFAGFYLGQDRIRAAATAMYGPPPATRPGISFHWRIQPVIHVSHDGRSANLRTRLFQPRTSKPTAAGGAAPTGILGGALFTGMYPNDQAVLEDGIWRLWSLTIDEPYMTTQSWKGGWAGVRPVPPGQAAGQSPLVERLPPDILMTRLGRRAEHFRGGTGETLAWPDILPMWFHYRNPVSGRVPEHYWPDSVPSLLLPQSRLIANGYQMPPNGPERDGIDINLTPPEAGEMARE